MPDQVKIVAIGTVGIVTVLSFVLLPAAATIHNALVYGLLSLVGVSIMGAAISWIAGKKWKND